LFCFDRKLKKGGQKVKKGPLRFLKNFSKFFANSSQQNFRVPPLGKQWFFSTPPPFLSPSPLSVFKGLPERLSFLAWNGIVTLWTSTSAKGGVYGAAVYFFLADDDLQQRE